MEAWAIVAATALVARLCVVMKHSFHVCIPCTSRSASMILLLRSCSSLSTFFDRDSVLWTEVKICFS